MPLNDDAICQIQLFAAEGVDATDLLPLADYQASLDRRRGHQPGRASAQLENRVLRQTSLIAASVAQYIANRHAPGVLDNADIDAVEAGLVEAVLSQIQGAAPQNATTEIIGLVELAEIEEVKAGTAADLVVTPEGLAAVLKDIHVGRAPGDVFWTAAAAPPDGSLKANGAAVPREQYAALFAAIGITYGAGDGVTTFNLPNLVNRMPIGAGGLYALGAAGGEAAHVLTVAEMPSHTHYVANADTGGNASLSVSTSLTKVVSGSYGLGGTATVPIIGVSSPSGSGAAHNNLPPFAALLPCIQY